MKRVGVRASLFAILLVLSACPPGQGTCSREFVTPTGDVPTMGVISFVDAGSPLGIQGRAITSKVFAPKTGCERDRLSARVELLGPDNFPVTDFTLTEPRLGANSTVSVDVTFTPAQTGQYLMSLVFEPALGVRSQLLDVGELKTSAPFVPVTVPNLSGCVDSVWPVNADTVACERNTKNVELYSSDGGTMSFAGEQLVVAGSAFWSVTSPNELQRRELVDGGLLITHRFAEFSNSTVRGLHDEQTALRARIDGSLVLASTGNVAIADLNRQSNAVGEQLLFADDFVLFTETPCQFLGCFGLLGLEPSVLWTSGFNGAQLSGTKRPVQVEGTPDISLNYKFEFPIAPQRGFERVPLWLESSEPGLSVLVNADRPSLGLTIWRRSQVLRVGKDFVVLKSDAANEVRVTPR